MTKLSNLLGDIRACNLCAEELPLGPRPVLRASSSARLLIAGQAPGTAVHKRGIPFDDPSGERLRRWMGVNRETFYDEQKIAIVPMGFCYPGRGKSGDLPPLKRCATTWREPLLDQLGEIRLTLAIGQYAIAWHFPEAGKTLTETVKTYDQAKGDVFPLPHPSPRNNIWLTRNPWFEERVVPALQQRVRACLE